MHELLLHAYLPASRHTQILNVLAGIAAMQPQVYHERHAVYKPMRPTTRPATQVGGSQAVQSNPVQAAIQGDLFYLHLVEDLADASDVVGENPKDVEDQAMGGMTDGAVETGTEKDAMNVEVTALSDPSVEDSDTATKPKWTLQFRDIPEAGNRRPVTTRLVADIPISSGDTAAFMMAMDYTHISTHHLRGHRFTYGSVLMLLFQPVLSSPLPSTNTTARDSSTYILQTSIRVADGTKVDQINRGVKELMALKEMLKGSIDLEMVERTVLDTRVR
ncbi:MAG: hypothetical protein Q9174_004931 [Haloplaca sp. 1 TL-2023]